MDGYFHENNIKSVIKLTRIFHPSQTRLALAAREVPRVIARKRACAALLASRRPQSGQSYPTPGVGWAFWRERCAAAGTIHETRCAVKANTSSIISALNSRAASKAQRQAAYGLVPTDMDADVPDLR